MNLVYGLPNNTVVLRFQFIVEEGTRRLPKESDSITPSGMWVFQFLSFRIIVFDISRACIPRNHLWAMACELTGETKKQEEGERTTESACSTSSTKEGSIWRRWSCQNWDRWVPLLQLNICLYEFLCYRVIKY